MYIICVVIEDEQSHLWMVVAPVSSYKNKKTPSNMPTKKEVARMIRENDSSRHHNAKPRVTPKSSISAAQTNKPGGRKARKELKARPQRSLPAPGTASFSADAMTAVSEFSFTTSANGFGAVVFNPSLCWTDARDFENAAPAIKAKTSYYSSPLNSGDSILSVSGDPGYSGQYPSSGSIDDWAGHVQWLGTEMSVYYNGTELNKGGSIHFVRGEYNYSFIEADRTTGTLAGTSIDILTTSPQLASAHHMGSESHCMFMPYGNHLQEITEIPERMLAASAVSRNFLPDIDTSYAPNGYNCACALRLAGGAQPIRVRLTHKYRTRMYQHIGSGPTVNSLRPASSTFLANPNLMASVSGSVADNMRAASTTGQNQLVTTNGKPKPPGLLGQAVNLVLGPSVSGVVEGVVGKLI